jgi:hypothetical protein
LTPRTWAAPAVAALLWLHAVATTTTDDLGLWGLLPALPLTWYAAVALLLVPTWLMAVSPRPPARALGVHLAALVVVLHGTAAAVYEAPRYTFTYKHIGVTEYVVQYGGIDPSIDIYHRWPGLFAAAGWLTEVTGGGDPIRFVAWSEPAFALLGSAAVLALARAVTADERTAWQAAVLSGVLNWVGQNYFSPQAVAFVLMIGVGTLVARFLTGPPGPVGRLVERLVRAVLRVRLPEPPAALPRRPTTPAQRLLVLVLVLLLHFAAVVTHQLTPYALLVQLGALAVLGVLRPLWLVVLMGGLTVLQLVPNFDYVNGRFGLFSGADPLGNATRRPDVLGVLADDKVLQGRLTLLLVLFVWLGALAGAVRRARSGQVRSALLVAVPAFAPMSILVGQAYGGEVRLRVFLFSLPWCCIAITWLWAPVSGALRSRARATTLALVAGLTALFAVSFYGADDLNEVPPDVVEAATRIYRDGQTDAAVLLVAPNFPDRYGPDYTRLGVVALPSLASEGFADRTWSPRATEADVDEVLDLMDEFALDGYLVFSSTQERYARARSIFPGGSMARLEAAVAASPSFRRVFDSPDARVYARDD